MKEFLDNETIKHSVSPYSSSIILVKKKDDSWRMCIDYRELNKKVVKAYSKFLMLRSI